MKNPSHIGSGGHRPAALEPGSSSNRAASPALASFGRAGTGGLYSSPARGQRELRLSLSPNAPSKTGITPSRRAALMGSSPNCGPTGVNPGACPPSNSNGSWNRFVAFPGVPVKLLYRQWKQADPTLPALSAVYRWLEQNDLDAHGRRYLLRQNIPGPTKAFEAPGVNDLWIVDFSPGALPGLASQDGGHSSVSDHR